MLLSGPPGLGKTTLAHVLARQAGYNTIEVNASDDRSGKVVEDRIRNSVESVGLSAGVLHANNKAATIGVDKKRPFCVVIDEIDGAGGGGENVRRLALALSLSLADSVKRLTARYSRSSRCSSDSSQKATAQRGSTEVRRTRLHRAHTER